MNEPLGLPPLPRTDDINVVADYLRKLAEYVARQSKTPTANASMLDPDTSARLANLEDRVSALEAR